MKARVQLAQEAVTAGAAASATAGTGATGNGLHWSGDICKERVADVMARMQGSVELREKLFATTPAGAASQPATNK